MIPTKWTSPIDSATDTQRFPPRKFTHTSPPIRHQLRVYPKQTRRREVIRVEDEEGTGEPRRLPDHADLAVGLEGDGGEEGGVVDALEHDLWVEQRLALGEHPRGLADAQLELPERIVPDHPHRLLLPAPLHHQRYLLRRRRLRHRGEGGRVRRRGRRRRRGRGRVRHGVRTGEEGE